MPPQDQQPIRPSPPDLAHLNAMLAIYGAVISVAVCYWQETWRNIFRGSFGHWFFLMQNALETGTFPHRLDITVLGLFVGLVAVNFVFFAQIIGHRLECGWRMRRHLLWRLIQLHALAVIAWLAHLVVFGKIGLGPSTWLTFILPIFGVALAKLAIASRARRILSV
jgi:hypothetical protein